MKRLLEILEGIGLIILIPFLCIALTLLIIIDSWREKDSGFRFTRRKKLLKKRR